MNIDFSPLIWEAVKASHRAWWEGANDKPLAHVVLQGRDPGRKEPILPSYAFTSMYDLPCRPQRLPTA